MTFSAFDHQCMALALRLARRGRFTCNPNPRVGCVLAAQGQVIGRGWHHRAGEPHAEINAMTDAGPLPKGSTAYVTLEPCSHQGRTPPCADALVEADVKRVVIATLDPNPQVNGRGVKQLEVAGVQVEYGLLAEQAMQLNQGFFKRHQQARPWVRVKTAISLDGRTALANGESQWISSAESREDVQRWRAQSSAILTGIGTVLADDPRLSARLAGEVFQPVPVVLDSQWRTMPEARLFAGDKPPLIFGSSSVSIPQRLLGSRAECVAVDHGSSGLELHQVMKALAERDVNEVQVEAGPALCGALLRSRLVDEILVYQAPVLLGAGAQPPFTLGPLESMDSRTHLRVLERRVIGADMRILLQPEDE